MKTTMKFFTYGFMIFSLMCLSCSEDGELGPMGPAGAQGADGIDGTDGTDGTNAPNALDEEVIIDFNLTAIQGGLSTMHRSVDGITVHFKTANLIPNNAYTLWFVVFGETPGPPISTFAAGHVAGDTGVEIFSAFKSVDADFINPMTAEIHLALRTHGPVQPDMILEQIQTMDGGCTSGFPSGPNLYADSTTVGYCANVQVAMHLIED